MRDINELYESAVTIMNHAYAPYSKFLVGSCIESESGNLYSGCNIENASYSLTVCAEACAICNMIAAGDKQIMQMAVVTYAPELAAPCGACRQRIYEFASPDIFIHIGNMKGKRASYRLADILPHAFSKADLERTKI